MKNQSYTIDYKNLSLTILKKKYIYFILGFLVCTIFFMVTLSFLKGYDLKIFNKNKITASKKIVGINPSFTQYRVKEGDDLWKIAEQAYGSGYNALDIAKANNLTDPEKIFTNQILNIPSVKPKDLTIGEISAIVTEPVKFKGSKYVVKQGDSLSKISLAAYGDLFMWQRIADANKIADINNLDVGTTLIIPR